MARIEISLPNEFDFSTNIPIRIGDINRGFHLGHDAIVLILEEARVQFLSSLGYTEQANTNKGTGYITADAGVIYKRQARYGQTLKVEVAVTDFTDKSFDIVYRISDASSGIEIARAKTGTLFFDYQIQKVVAVPDDFRKKFSR